MDCDDIGRTTINAVLVETDESEMNAGELEFYTWDGPINDGIGHYNGWTRCSSNSNYNGNGVGTNGLGGLFNCGGEGYAFAINCYDCPVMSIVEVFLWQEEAVLGATPYYIAGGYVAPEDY